MALNLNLKARDLAETILWSIGLAPTWDNSRTRGRYGEWLGRRLLRRKGYRIVVSNWRSSRDRRQEIDLVCRKEGVLVFVEVRARSEDSLVRGFDSLGNRKMKSLRRSFKSYLGEANFNANHYRFDVIEVDLPAAKGSKPKVFHHENVAIFA
jgi:putative endonuclease